VGPALLTQTSGLTVHPWHRTSTVLEVEARASTPAPVPQERIAELRQLVSELGSALVELEAGSAG